MDFQIKEIILWPRNEALLPKRHVFETGMVNVITGSSKTGKSAIIPIVDYCLASSTCSIPTGLIRESCSWFGVLIQLSGRQLLLARREPGGLDQSGSMLMLLDKEVVIPNKIDESLNLTNTSLVKNKLNELAGIPEFVLDLDSPQNYGSRPSFRDLLAFNFQPQNIIANPTSVFFRTDNSSYRERLKHIFPYALGAETAEILEAKWRLNSLRKILRFKKKELNDQTEVATRWKDEAALWIDRAFEYGLASIIEHSSAKTWDEKVELLKAIVVRKPDDSNITKEAIINIEEKNIDMEREEDALRYQLGILSRRQAELRGLAKEYKPYLDSLVFKKERISISSWLEALASERVENNLLEGGGKFSAVNLRSLSNAVEVLEGEIEAFTPNYQLILKESQKIDEEIALLLIRLREVQRSRLSVQRGSGQRDEQRYKNEEIARFTGSLEQALRIYEAQKADSELAKEVRELEIEIADLENFTSDRKIKRVIEEALEYAQSYGHKILQGLDVEDPERVFEIDTENLTIKVSAVQRKDYLWQIGSGANWLAYHLATIFGLQGYFLTLKGNPVPNFIILDQPSQVYFPTKNKKGRKRDESFDHEIEQDDVEAVRKIYRTLSKIVNDQRNNIQVIVLDHADKDIWGEMQSIHLAGRWRGNNKLVPLEWLPQHMT